MATWPELAVATAATVAVVWATLVAALILAARRHRLELNARDVATIIPDVVRMLRSLASDGSLPSGVRLRIALLVVYLLSPIDLVPDFIPVVGQADDVLVVALVLRSVVRRAGADVVDRHWTGSDVGRRAVRWLAGLD